MSGRGGQARGERGDWELVVGRWSKGFGKWEGFGPQLEGENRTAE